ncbi:MAG: hypothetical protein NZ922_05655 [Candidatus Methanomethyliaceae archaeon]|nr:hypothetical protein [Candidatus Methanomethyliaceae archaeon]MDW7971252.1 hypothetical protein [Nitrososphaerota archaeon]
MREEVKYALISVLIMIFIDVFILVKRLLGDPIFQPLFELLIFHFPLILLILYLIKEILA